MDKGCVAVCGVQGKITKLCKTLGKSVCTLFFVSDSPGCRLFSHFLLW